MKNIFTLILMLSCMTLMAQNPQNHQRPQRQAPNMEKYLQDRTDFVIGKMKLSPADSIKFVPIYKEKLKAKGNLMTNSRPPHIHPGKEYADSVYMKAVEMETNYKVEDAKIDQEYNKKFSQILTPKQLFIYMQAEKQFIGSFMHRGPRRGQNAEQTKK